MSAEESYQKIIEVLNKEILQPKQHQQIAPKPAIKVTPIQTYKKSSFSFKNKFLILSFIIILICSSILVSTATNLSNQIISSSGFIYTMGVEVYADPSCTINVTKVDWGQLNPGASITKTAYIKNSGSSNLTLSLSTTNWQPPIMQQYLSVSWNATNYKLMSGQTVTAIFTLSVVSNASGGSFSHNIIVAGQDVIHTT